VQLVNLHLSVFRWVQVNSPHIYIYELGFVETKSHPLNWFNQEAINYSLKSVQWHQIYLTHLSTLPELVLHISISTLPNCPHTQSVTDLINGFSISSKPWNWLYVFIYNEFDILLLPSILCFEDEHPPKIQFDILKMNTRAWTNNCLPWN
jgi:hypothetical protein